MGRKPRHISAEKELSSLLTIDLVSILSLLFVGRKSAGIGLSLTGILELLQFLDL